LSSTQGSGSVPVAAAAVSARGVVDMFPVCQLTQG
jgi:hypothetical protein